MKDLIRYLQHPLVPILATPLAAIVFGLIAGITTSTSFELMTALFLFLTLVFSNLINHYQYQKFIKNNQEVVNPSLFYTFTFLMLASAILFMLRQHWIINLLLIFYLSFILMKFYPLRLVNSPYYFILNVFFNSFLLNAMAYFSQARGINSMIMKLFIPIVFYVAGIELLNEALKGTLPSFKGGGVSRNRIQQISLGLMIVAIILGVYFSQPSRSLFFVQILFVLISLTASLPAIVPVSTSQKVQNKLNYNAAMSLIFSLTYALSFIF